ncbi:MAG: hypothetical protein WA484_15715 [Solirubrobacteraceae bacterium]
MLLLLSAPFIKLPSASAIDFIAVSHRDPKSASSDRIFVPLLHDPGDVF